MSSRTPENKLLLGVLQDMGPRDELRKHSRDRNRLAGLSPPHAHRDKTDACVSSSDV